MKSNTKITLRNQKPIVLKGVGKSTKLKMQVYFPAYILNRYILQRMWYYWIQRNKPSCKFKLFLSFVGLLPHNNHFSFSYFDFLESFWPNCYVGRFGLVRVLELGKDKMVNIYTDVEYAYLVLCSLGCLERKTLSHCKWSPIKCHQEIYWLISLIFQTAAVYTL